VTFIMKREGPERGGGWPPSSRMLSRLRSHLPPCSEPRLPLTKKSRGKIAPSRDPAKKLEKSRSWGKGEFSITTAIVCLGRKSARLSLCKKGGMRPETLEGSKF